MLEAFHHPYFNVGRSSIQDEMFRAMGHWVNDLEDREHVIGALTKVSGVSSIVHKTHVEFCFTL